MSIGYHIAIKTNPSMPLNYERINDANDVMI